jgi:hypothetical protein
MDGGHAAPTPGIAHLRRLRRAGLLAAALALVIAGGAIGMLSSGSHPARAAGTHPMPSFVGHIPALSDPAPQFAGAVPALAVVARPVRHHRTHRSTPPVTPTTPSDIGASQSVAATASSTAAPPVASTPVATSPATSSGSTAVRSTSSSSAKTPAFGASGALGPGSSPSS